MTIPKDIASGKVTWEYKTQPLVDPETGQNLGEYRGRFFVFPREVEKETYILNTGSFRDIELAFQTEERVEGLDTYLFEYRGEMEYTFSYASTDDYAGVDVEPGQEIRCSEAGLVVRYWVEPTTGEIVKSDEGCLSGDAVYDVESGEKLYEISRWRGISAGDDVIQRAALIRKRRQSYLWAARYFPGLLILAGVISLGAGIIPRKPSSDSGPGS